MRKGDPRDLAVALCSRSTCKIRMAAVIHDDWGIFAWGWNHAGDGFGQHAEIHALKRANRKRLIGATITVAGKLQSGNFVSSSEPCDECKAALANAGIRRARHIVQGAWIVTWISGWSRVH